MAMKHHSFVTLFLLWTVATRSYKSFAFQRPLVARLQVLPLVKPETSLHSAQTHSEDHFVDRLGYSYSKNILSDRLPILAFKSRRTRRRIRPDHDRRCASQNKKHVVAVAASLLPKVLAAVATAFVVCTEPARAASLNTVLPPFLGTRNLWYSSLVLMFLGALPLSILVPSDEGSSLARTLLVSAARCAVQVSLLGSLLLQRMMGVTHPACVGAWILGVGVLAGRECASRIRYRYPGMRRNLYGSIATGGWVVLGLALGLRLLGSVRPWFEPRTWIPIAGMLFGNTLNAAALAAASITKQFATESDAVELRLARGAGTKDAIGPLVEESYRISLLPTMNGLAATGIIHIPGMMSGQILAGQSPQQAALYQIVINFLIATTALVTVQLIIQSSVRALVSNRGKRLRSGVLEPTTNNNSNSNSNNTLQPFSLASVFSLLKSTSQQKSKPQHAVPQKRRLQTRTCASASSSSADGTATATPKPNTNNGTAPVLALNGLQVERANATIDLELRPGDRIAVYGKSGTGKSQLLRTIVGLEEAGGTGGVSLFGKPVFPSDLPRFRSRVSLVPQTNPPLEGTPNQFYREILRFQSRQQQDGQRERESAEDPVGPIDIASRWDLEPEAFDKTWRTLSGGESQRASLAIALALKPNVLLLDESTNSLDDATSVLVEDTLRKSQIPIVIVTHSDGQLERFCTHRLDL